MVVFTLNPITSDNAHLRQDSKSPNKHRYAYFRLLQKATLKDMCTSDSSDCLSPESYEKIWWENLPLLASTVWYNERHCFACIPHIECVRGAGGPEKGVRRAPVHRELFPPQAAVSSHKDNSEILKSQLKNGINFRNNT